MKKLISFLEGLAWAIFAPVALWTMEPFARMNRRTRRALERLGFSPLGMFAAQLDYNLGTLDAYKVNRQGQAEVVRQRVYDFQLYPTAGQAQLTFFALPIGQGITSSLGAAVGAAKTYADTNMESAGQFARPKSYLCESIEIVLEPGSSAAANTFAHQPPNQFAAVAAAALLQQVADVNIIRISGWLEFYIGSKTYLWEAPLGSFPPKARLELDAAIASNSATTAEAAAVYAKWGGRPYYLDPPITLESLQNFAVYLKWPGVVATPSGFNARIGVVFDGVLYRLSQ